MNDDLLCHSNSSKDDVFSVSTRSALLLGFGVQHGILGIFKYRAVFSNTGKYRGIFWGTAVTVFDPRYTDGISQ
jgi:hypothetical protein